jgi:signal peptidase I
MNGDGYGAPPWGPADPVPELADTQAIPGLGSIPGPGEQQGRPQAGQGFGSEGNGRAANGPGSYGRGPNDSPPNGPGAGGPSGGSGMRQDSPGDAKDGKSGTEGKRRRSFWRELPVLIVVALVLALIVKSFLVQAFYIPSGSMQNTLAINDRVLINKVVYHLRPIHRGDIVVFDGTGSWDFSSSTGSSNIFSKAVDELEGLVGISQDPNIYIKRVIGLPGDHVVCCNTAGQVTVNGVPLSESSYLYPDNAPSTQKFNITVPAGRLWVMGDHRQISYDSRGHMGDPGGGTIPESGVLGRAFVIIWPPSQVGFLNIPATFEQPRLNASSAAGGNAAAGGSSATLETALDNGTPVRPTTSPLPLALGFVGAVPITWLQRKARRRLKSRRSKR